MATQRPKAKKILNIGQNLDWENGSLKYQKSYNCEKQLKETNSYVT